MGFHTRSMAREGQEEQSLELERLGGIYVIDSWERTPRLVSYSALSLTHQTPQRYLKPTSTWKELTCLGSAAIVEDLGKPPRSRPGLIHIHECAL
jgi:ADP-ribose pyrophosphatase YjhB (NUDIX family)